MIWIVLSKLNDKRALFNWFKNKHLEIKCWDRDQDHPHEKEMQKAVWGGLTNSCEKKRSEKQRRKGKI